LTPKKILEISSDSRIGGVTRHILTLAKYIDRKKYKFIIVSCSGWFIDEAQRQKLDYFKCNFQSAFDLRHIWKLRQFIKKEKPNLIHLHGVRAGAIGILAVLFLNIPIIYSEHLYTKDYHLKSWFREKMQINFLKLVLYRAQIIIAPSKAVRNFLIKNLKIKENKIIIVYNGLENRDLKYKYPKNLKIGFIGSLNEQKGVHYLIAAMYRLVLRFPKLKLEIIGDGSLRSILEIRTRSLKDSITFLGAKENILSTLNSWNLLVIPSVSESFGQVALEAAIVQKPIVATRVGGLPEIVLNYRTGILVEPKNPDELVKAISYLLSNPKLMQTMGLEAKKRFKKKFTAQKMAQNLNLIYGQLI
jgi:glycosyltransferase involved in cell wall biosynthesis